MKRTPGKWEFTKRSSHDGIKDAFLWSGNDIIANGLSLHDAAYIVRAVNCHEMMLDYCRGILEVMTGKALISDDPSCIEDIKNIINEAERKNEKE